MQLQWIKQDWTRFVNCQTKWGRKEITIQSDAQSYYMALEE